MDSVKLWVKLFTMGCALFGSLAVNCNWKTQYEHEGRCCDACPSGQYPKTLCTDTSPSVCEKCMTANNHNTICSCGDKPLCKDSECSSCLTRPRCKQGQQLIRTGYYNFNYQCYPCPNNTYNDAEDSMCEPITQCRKVGLPELFAGNRTHNARCGCHSQCSLLDCHQLSPNIMTAYISITVLICLTLLISLALFTNLHLRKMKKYHPTNRSLMLLSDEGGCKLSKEEMGE